MAKDAEQIRVALDMHIFVDDVGATEPDGSWDYDADSLEDVGWTELGWNTKDGVSATWGRTTIDIFGQGSRDVLRRLVTEAPQTIAFTLEEFTLPAFDFATGGQTSTVLGSGYSVEPTDISVLQEKAVAFDWEDGDLRFIYIARRCLVSGDVTIPFADNAAVTAAVTVALQQPSDPTQKPGNLFTNAPAFAPVGS